MSQFDMTLLEKVDSTTEQKKGRMSKVILVNDETTDMVMVMLCLHIVFDKSIDESQNLMMTAHLSGRATIGVMPKKLALAKAKEGMDFVHEVGYKDFTILCEDTDEEES